MRRNKTTPNFFNSQPPRKEIIFAMQTRNVDGLKNLLNLSKTITFFTEDQIGFNEIQCLTWALVGNTSLQKLRFLDCVDIGNRKVGLFINPLMNNTSLKLLSFISCGITDQGAQAIANILPNCKLETLAFTDNRIGNIGFGALVNALKHNPTLKNINLMGNRINVILQDLNQLLQCNYTLRTFFVDNSRLQEQLAVLTNRNKSLAAGRLRDIDRFFNKL